MINSIYFNNKNLRKHYDLEWNMFSHQYSIKLRVKNNSLQKNKISFFIRFSTPISSYRAPFYRWASLTDKNTYLNANSSKIIVLNNGTHFLSTKNIGAWIIRNPTTIEWVLKAVELTPLFKYDSNGKRNFNDLFKIEDYDLGLLFTKNEVPEFSRSKLPFKPIVCFTDHCDFDNNNNLEKQLAFFKKYNVKTSKGFFLNHFSKREDNSSYEKEPELIISFQDDGHELFYHALTQSSRNKYEAINEFKNFRPPLELDIKTYVDHGYQIYNLTKRHNTGLNDAEWSKIISQKGIENFWTYLDSGTSMNGVCNQLNPDHFTLSNLIKHNGFSLKKIIRTELFFRGNESTLLAYRRLAKFAKNIKKNRTIKGIFFLLNVIRKVAPHLVHSLLFRRNQTFKYANYTPWVFQSTIGMNTYNFFQTIEVTNFEETFSKRNIETLKKESGVLIAHCYFASPLSHQKGRLFDGNEISTKNHQNFDNLREEILAGNIWNPTISELINYVNQLNRLEFSWDAGKQKIVCNTSGIPLNYIKYDG